MAEKSDTKPVYHLIDDINGKNAAKIEALKSTIKIFNVENKVEIMERKFMRKKLK